jgi:hypothetical protein
MLCHRGCGIEGTYVNYKGLPCCDKSAQKCPVVRKKIGDASGETRRKTPCLRSEAHKIEQSKRIKQQWESGKRVVTDKTIENAKRLALLRPAVPWNKGLKGSQVPWNKGLKKQESPDILAREDPAYSNFKKYRNRVAVRTRKTYEQYKSEINPNSLPIGKCGIEGAHQVDHIVTVREGFERGIAIEEISAKENLQVIPWLENIQKYDGKGLRKSNK